MAVNHEKHIGKVWAKGYKTGQEDTTGWKLNQTTPLET
jgi:hypothetical protein